jgi:hypothetical protein
MFDIGVKNGLLEPKHIQAMGEAVWLFLWCIDKVTKETDGWGVVLGGKPIRYAEVQQQLGIAERTYKRWLEILRQHEYIKTTRAPYGLVIKVNKTKKRYAKNGTSDRPEMAHLGDKNGTSNKTYSRHNNKTLPAKAGRRMKKNQFNYSEDKHSDEYEDVIDIETGEKAKPAPKANASETMRNILTWAEGRRGGKFINYPKQIKAFALMRKAGKTPQQVKDRWCDMEVDPFWKERGFDFMDVANSFNKRA